MCIRDSALGADEAVFHRGVTVTECAHSNVSIIKNGVLFTHPADCFILSGTARENLLKKCTELKIPFSLRPFTLDALYTADEVLVTSSSKICVLAKSVNAVEYDSSKNSIGSLLCRSLFKDFMEATE